MFWTYSLRAMSTTRDVYPIEEQNVPNNGHSNTERPLQLDSWETNLLVKSVCLFRFN